MSFRDAPAISISFGLRCPLARLIDGPVTGLDALLIERGNSAPTAHVFVDRQSIVGLKLAVGKFIVGQSSVGLSDLFPILVRAFDSQRRSLI